MTSGKFQSVPIGSIVVDREARQRKSLTDADVQSLAESINRLGLIHPPVVTSELVLVAGETRLMACLQLGWTSIPVQFVEDLPPQELKKLELEENVKRKNLTWQEECLALQELHSLHKAESDEWTHQQTADIVGLSRTMVSKQLEVAKSLDNDVIRAADKFAVAFNMVARESERRKSSALTEIGASVVQLAAPEQPVPEPEEKPVPILPADFHEWQQTYDGPKFNLIHCDFPYGINVTDAPRQNASIKDSYEDSKEIYWALMERLGLAMSNIVAESAHLIFWFSMEKYCATHEALANMGWKVNPFPLVWHKIDNAGIAPDPQRWARRTYETAFMASRGDRKLTTGGTRAASTGFPGRRDTSSHVSEKPIPVLKHFMNMVCDDYSRVFDPTCGSGNSLKVAEQLGASEVLGLELDPNFYQWAVDNWNERSLHV